MFSVTEESFLLRSLREVVMVWKGGTGQASFNLSINRGSADLQLGFQLGRPDEPHLQPQQQQRQKGAKRQERDRARAEAHQASQVVDSATATSSASASTLLASTISAASAVSTTDSVLSNLYQASDSPFIHTDQAAFGTPAFTPPTPATEASPPPVRRPSTRSTKVLVKMAAFARSAAESAIIENLPNFIPGFNERLEFFKKECDFGEDGNERKYFNKYSSKYVFGFYCERKIVTKELVERITCQWASKDRYWDNRPTNVIEIVL